MNTRYLFGLPLLTLTIGTIEVEAIVDTGFNGALLLSTEVIRKLKLPRIGFAQYAMADGVLSEAEVYTAEIWWFGKQKEVSVVSSNADFSLIGMELLHHCRTIFCPVKNILTIEEESE